MKFDLPTQHENYYALIIFSSNDIETSSNYNPFHLQKDIVRINCNPP